MLICQDVLEREKMMKLDGGAGAVGVQGSGGRPALH